MSDIVIRAEKLGKKYRIQHQHERQRYTALRDVLADRAKSLFCNLQSAEALGALKTASFEIKQGEVLS